MYEVDCYKVEIAGCTKFIMSVSIDGDKEIHSEKRLINMSEKETYDKLKNDFILFAAEQGIDKSQLKFSGWNE